MPLPLPTPVSAPTAPSRRRSPGRVGSLVLTAFALAALATVSGHALGLALLVAATVALGIAAALTMRAHWAAAVASDPRPVAAPTRDTAPADGDALTEALRRLHAAHVEKVNLALDEGREDLAREFADSYADEALALLTRSA